MEAIAKTETRPASDNRITLEITTPSGKTYSFEIGADPYYRALTEILRAEKAKAAAVAAELPLDVPPPSSFDPVGNAS